MSGEERAVTFACAGETLVGVVSAAGSASAAGVLIVVGGPQYRAGSHRAFVLLARALALAGVPAMRVDYRGMGDASGASRSFEDIDEDIAAAIAAFGAACPAVERVVLWGLCDAASAALAYWQRTRDARIAAMALVNPWVRSAPGIARVRLRHYYAQRALARDFWTRLLRGRVGVRAALGDLLADLRAGLRGRAASAPAALSFQDRMAEGWRAFERPLLLVLSGRDLTAKEFLDRAGSDPRWAGLLARPNVTRHDVPDADHTFSSARWRADVEAATLAWLRQASLAPPR